MRFMSITGFILLAGVAALLLASRLPDGALSHLRQHPVGIVIHHTATPPAVNGRPVDVAFIDRLHAQRGFVVTSAAGTEYHIGYHYLILQDGTVQHGRPEHLRGAHTRGHADTLGIALVGNFERRDNRGRSGPLAPPPAQVHALAQLTSRLMVKYRLTSDDVHLHCDLGATACPGDGFPRAAFYQALAVPDALARRSNDHTP